MNTYLNRAQDLDLPMDLHQEILDVIAQDSVVPTSSFYTKDSGINWWQRIFLWASLDNGRFQIYRLPEKIVTKIEQHYAALIEKVGRPYKIRLKSTANARWLFPHSDTETMDASLPQGDRCSLVLAIQCNDEVTNYYEFNGDQFRYRIRDFMRLRRRFSVTVKPREAWLYNNVPVHSVTGCDPARQRFLLAISWQDVEYRDLLAAYTSMESTKHDITD